MLDPVQKGCVAARRLILDEMRVVFASRMLPAAVTLGAETPESSPKGACARRVAADDVNLQTPLRKVQTVNGMHLAKRSRISTPCARNAAHAPFLNGV